jgi:hypothetical protein
VAAGIIVYHAVPAGWVKVVWGAASAAGVYLALVAAVRRAPAARRS